MFTLKQLKVFGSCVLGFNLGSVAIAEKLVFGSDVWCPFNCEPNSANPGYMVEILQEAMKPVGHTIEYKIIPWQRALGDAKEGKIAGVFGASKEDAKNYGLKQPSESLGLSSNCIFVQSSSHAKFSKVDDFNQFKKIGIINEYTYSSDIDGWLKNPANKSKIDSIAGDDVAATNAKKLDAGRLDAVVEDGNVFNYQLDKLKLTSKIKSAGCAENIEVYAPFSAALKNADELTKALDQGVKELRKSGKLKTIMAKYGLKDWK
jgi:polar amino acid transport system substrate-binding protein